LSHQIPINVAFEDELSEEVLTKLLLNSRRYLIGRRFPGRGYGDLKKKIRGFNNAARVMPYLVLTDLDDDECAPTKIRIWLPIPKHPNLLFRVAVKEVEAWLLADQVGFAKFLGIGRNLVPVNVDEVEDPKRSLIDLAKRSRKRKLREEMIA